MNRRGSLGLLVFLAIVALLTWFEVPSWHGGEGAVAVLPAPTPTADTKSANSTPADTKPATATPADTQASASQTAPATAAAPATQVASASPDSAAAAPKTEVMPGPAAGPTFDVVRVEPTGEAVLAGQAEPKASVELLDGNAPIATTKTDDTGAWAIALDKPLTPGSHDLGLRATSEDKGTATLSDQRVAVSVPDKSSKDVLVVLNSPNAPSKVLEVPAGTAAAPAVEPAPDTGAQVATAEPSAPDTAQAETPIASEAPVTSEPPVAVEAPVAAEAPVKAEPPLPAEPKVAEAPAPPKPEVVVGAVEADTSGGLYVGGTAKTGETVRIYLNDKPLGDSTPTAAGTWLVQGKRDLPAGKYTVRADQIDADGKVVARSEVPFEREVEVADLKPSGESGAGQTGATAAGQVTMETVIIKRGDNLWRIARGAWGNGMRWTTIYQANNDQICNPHWIYPGQVFIMPKGDATWTE